MDILCLLLDHYSGIKPSALVLQPLKCFLGETSVFLEHLAFSQHGSYVFFPGQLLLPALFSYSYRAPAIGLPICRSWKLSFLSVEFSIKQSVAPGKPQT